MSALLLRPSNLHKALPDGKWATMKEALNDAHIEIVHIPGPRPALLLVDEDGRLKGLPLNIPASKLMGMEIVGPAVFLTGKEKAQFNKGQ